MFRVGDKVKINTELVSDKFKNMNKDILDNEFKVSRMVLHDGGIAYILEGIPTFKEWFGIGIDGETMEKEWMFKEHKLIKVKAQQKTNRIRRNTTGSVLEYEIKDKELRFEITEHPMFLATVCKMVLEETELYNYKYERVSPFKINKGYNPGIPGHVISIDFIDIRTKENVHNELFVTDKAMRLSGEYKIFIPDFLEVCVKLGILRRDENGYKLNKKLNSMKDCEYIQDTTSDKYLLSRGYTIPTKWKMYK